MSKAIWGVFFVLLGVSLAGRAVGVFDFNIFFPGWWTLFIIVPSAIGLVSAENRTASVFGLGIGILLLVSVQNIINWYTFSRLVIALIFVVIGCSFLFRRDRRAGQDDYHSGGRDFSREGNSQSGSDNQDYGGSDNDGSEKSHGSSHNPGNSGSSQGTGHYGYNHFTSFLSGRNIQFVDEEFTGADVTSILGNVQLDLRNAILKDDVVIETTCILGGVDIYVPDNAKVVSNCTPILGGVENKVIMPYNGADTIYTIYIRGTCILGGIEVK